MKATEPAGSTTDTKRIVTERSNSTTDRNEGDGTDWQYDGYKVQSDGKPRPVAILLCESKASATITPRRN
ncbi:hypothetical protein [Lysinibacillus sp. FJAT-14222]|uniref:hypothetical protein n=1 Tax=Lysinibacillus sp. FJAT-14222 TaxID=1932366 RepID=UPI00116049E2|nr:hypothetical protein [Lysinibacillus sp. FJAT-14222]